MLVPGLVIELHEAHAASPPAGAPAGSCWRRMACPARRRRVPASPWAPWRCPSVRARSTCMRNAISKELMRVAISGSPVTVCAHFVQLIEGIQRIALQLPRPRPWDWRGTAPGRRCCGTPRPGRRWAGSRCPSRNRRRSAPCCPELNTTKPGRSRGLRAQPVKHPRAHAGAAELHGAGIHQKLAGRVVEGVGHHATSRWRCHRRSRQVRAAIRTARFRFCRTWRT